MKSLICILAISLLYRGVSFGVDAQGVALTAVGPGRPITLEISTPGGADFVLQRSLDLKTWLPFITVYSRTQQFRVVDRSQSDPLTRTTFVSAFGSAQTPEEMLVLWRRHEFASYRFTYQRVCF